MFRRTSNAARLAAIAASLLLADRVVAGPPVRIVERKIAFDRLIIVERPSLARQIAAAAKLSLPEGGVDVAVHCIVEADSGHLNCTIRDYGSTPVDMYRPAIIVADGPSCRHQIRDGTGRDPLHVARVLERSLGAR